MSTEGIGNDRVGSPGGLVVSVASEVEQAALLGAAAYAQGRDGTRGPGRARERRGQGQAQGTP